MNAKKCDRCGKLYERYRCQFSTAPVDHSNFNSFNLIREHFDGGREYGKILDLCPECAESLKKWLKGGQEESKDV